MSRLLLHKRRQLLRCRRTAHIAVARRATARAMTTVLVDTANVAAIAEVAPIRQDPAQVARVAFGAHRSSSEMARSPHVKTLDSGPPSTSTGYSHTPPVRYGAWTTPCSVSWTRVP